MFFLHALKWSFLADVIARILQPLMFLFLARLLTPEDFGVMTAALMVICFSQIFWEAGLGKALIQRQESVTQAANVVFWSNVCLGIVISTLLVFGASAIARIFFQDGRVTAVVQVMTLQVVFGSACGVHTALLQREFEFKKLFWVRLVSVGLPNLVAIPFALVGWGYWALVGGALMGQFLQLVILWHICDWRPTLKFDWQVAKEMSGFGFWVVISGVLLWFYMWVDSLIVGRFLSSHELGIYRMGNQVAIMVFAILLEPVTPILYSYLSKMKQDKQRLKSAMEKLIKLITFMAIPLAFIIFSLSDLGASVFLDEKWAGIGSVVGVMALLHGFSWVVGMNSEAYLAYGKPLYDALVMAICLPLFLIVFWYSIQQSFEFFVWSRLGVGFLALILHLYMLQRVFGIKMLFVVGNIMKVTVVSWTICAGVRVFYQTHVDSQLSELVTSLVSSSLLNIAVISMLERKGLVAFVVDYIKEFKSGS